MNAGFLLVRKRSYSYTQGEKKPWFGLESEAQHELVGIYL
jgi:hypothetical protein